MRSAVLITHKRYRGARAYRDMYTEVEKRYCSYLYYTRNIIIIIITCTAHYRLYASHSREKFLISYNPHSAS